MTDNAPRLMLITPVLDAGIDFSASLTSALEAGEFAAVILRVNREGEERALLSLLKPLVSLVQENGAAALIDGAPDLVGKSGADGAHVLGETQAREAVERFKPEKIVGAGGLRSRDAAMTAGEQNVDYVLFGDPGKAGEVPADAVAERLAWWAEIFTTPCVGQVDQLQHLAPLASTDADFIAFGGFVWTHPEGPAAAIREAVQTLTHERAA